MGGVEVHLEDLCEYLAKNGHKVFVARAKAINFSRNEEDKRNQILSVIERQVKSYFDLFNKEFLQGKSKIPLNVPSFGYEEIIEALECMLSTMVTMGEKVKQFEEMFANYVSALWRRF